MKRGAISVSVPRHSLPSLVLPSNSNTLRAPLLFLHNIIHQQFFSSAIEAKMNERFRGNISCFYNTSHMPYKMVEKPHYIINVMHIIFPRFSLYSHRN